jgi:hypothetical protein
VHDNDDESERVSHDLGCSDHGDNRDHDDEGPDYSFPDPSSEPNHTRTPHRRPSLLLPPPLESPKTWRADLSRAEDGELARRVGTAQRVTEDTGRERVPLKCERDDGAQLVRHSSPSLKLHTETPMTQTPSEAAPEAIRRSWSRARTEQRAGAEEVGGNWDGEMQEETAGDGGQESRSVRSRKACGYHDSDGDGETSEPHALDTRSSSTFSSQSMESDHMETEEGWGSQVMWKQRRKVSLVSP